MTAATAAVIPEMTDQAREDHIRDCGQRMEVAMAAGNRQEAVEWLQAETQAIGQRSPTQVARMTAEIDRAIDEGVNFFAACGARDAAAVRQEANQ